MSDPAIASTLRCMPIQSLFYLLAVLKTSNKKTLMPQSSSGRKTRMKLKDFDETFAADLSNPEFAAAYLAECLSYNEPEVFLLALRNVVQASSNMSEVSRKLEASRA